MAAYMKEILDKLLAVVLSLFPLSPFAPVIGELSELPYLGYINWFIPVGDFLKTGSFWIAAVGAYYAWSVIARWIKLVS